MEIAYLMLRILMRLAVLAPTVTAVVIRQVQLVRPGARLRPRCTAMPEKVPAYARCMTREEAHRLLDEVPEDRLADAVELLRQWARPEPSDVPRRQFRTTTIFDGEHDLGARA
jgi:hypothetical protein